MTDRTVDVTVPEDVYGKLCLIGNPKDMGLTIAEIVKQYVKDYEARHGAIDPKLGLATATAFDKFAPAD